MSESGCSTKNELCSPTQPEICCVLYTYVPGTVHRVHKYNTHIFFHSGSTDLWVSVYNFGKEEVVNTFVRSLFPLACFFLSALSSLSPLALSGSSSFMSYMYFHSHNRKERIRKSKENCLVVWRAVRRARCRATKAKGQQKR